MRPVWLVVLLVGCVPPSTLGVRTDALQPTAGGFEAALGGGVGKEHGEDWSQLMVGTQGVVGITDHVSAGMAVASGIDGEPGWMVAETRITLARPEERVPQGCLILGGGAYLESWEDINWAARLGFAGSVPVGWDLHPFVGLVLEPRIAKDLQGLPSYVMFGIGSSWRPSLGQHLRLLVAVESTQAWWLDSDGVERIGMGAGLMAGLSWER